MRRLEIFSNDNVDVVFNCGMGFYSLVRLHVEVEEITKADIGFLNELDVKVEDISDIEEALERGYFRCQPDIACMMD